jgi:DNA gyrase subunit A
MAENSEESLQQQGRIIQINIEEEMKSAYMDYSMSVIVGRALPDVRDGLKPVHRRVLFAMQGLTLYHSKPTKKSARIVGEVLGKYHPHGDKAVYDAMVRMAQPWSMRYTLVDGQGNFGAQDGDGPAAMRYTEARLKELAENMLADLDKETVDFTLNFDDSLEEPTVLPTRIPNLLVNGSSGIAVGMATNMMPHNLSEVVDGCIAYIGNHDITIDELMVHVKAPDFPTSGIIYGMEGIKQAMHTGRGRVVLRGRVEVEAMGNGKDKIVITEVPYQVSRDALAEKIGQLVNNKVIDGITHVANESNKDGTRIVIELRRDAMAQVIINQLYKYSELQTSYGVNNVALVKGRPQTLNLKSLIAEFVEFRHEVVVRRTQYELREAEKRAHILEGFLIALDHLDEVITLIRNSQNPEEAKNGLMSQFGLSEIQSKAILELRLQRLTGMERDKIREEFAEVAKMIEYLRSVLADEGLRMQIIKDELLEVKRKFGDERRTEIQFRADEVRMEDMIAEEDMVITISHLGYIKRTSAEDYRQQRRGGRGMIGGRTRNEDFIEHLFVSSTHHTLLFFTDKGRCYWIKAYEIPEGEKQGKGRAIQNMVNLPADDNIRAILDVKKLNEQEFINSHYILLATKKGIIKKTLLEDFSRPRQNGVNAITINEGDELLAARLTNGNCFVMLAVRSGRSIRFHEEKVRVTGRGAIGVRGIEVDSETDEVVGMICVEKDNEIEHKTVMVVSQKGFGKRTDVRDYRITNRGGKGVKTINITEKTGALIAMLGVEETDDLMIICKSGIIIRMAVADIRAAGRATQGVRLIRLSGEDEIAAIACIQEDNHVDDQLGITPAPDDSAPKGASGDETTGEAGRAGETGSEEDTTGGDQDEAPEE